MWLNWGLRLLLWFWVCVGIGWWFYGYLVGVLGFVRCVSFWWLPVRMLIWFLVDCVGLLLVVNSVVILFLIYLVVYCVL